MNQDVDWENWFGDIVAPSAKLLDDAKDEAKHAKKALGEINYLLDDEADARTSREAKEIADQAESAITKAFDVIEDYEEAFECAEREIHELKQVIDFALNFCGAIEVLDAEVIKWCQENMKGDWQWHGYDFPLDHRSHRHYAPERKWIVVLTEDNDKLLFKMRWTEGS